ncbi:MAG TPA: YcxB family protein [Gemmataceae bacterium]|jgi:hypothetical protein
MEIEYELTAADMAAFLRFQTKHRPKGKQLPLVYVLRIVLAPVPLIIAGLYGWFYWQPRGAWLSGCCAGVIIGFLSIIVFQGWLQAKTLIPNAIRFYWDRDESRWYFARRCLRIGASGIEMKNEVQHLRYSWSIVWMIGSTDKHIFLCIARSTAIIIPRRVFSDAACSEEFLALARQYQQGREQQSAKPTGIIAGLPPQSGAFTHPDIP